MNRPLIRHLPSRAEVCRDMARQLDAETRDNFDCYLALLERAIKEGRVDAALKVVEEFRVGLSPEN
jgi:hypothetical protein